jgi:hypothetical protein
MQRENVAHAAARARDSAQSSLVKLGGLGIYDAQTHGLSAARAKEIGKLGADASTYANIAMGQTAMEAGYSGTAAGAEGDLRSMHTVEAGGRAMSGILAGKSVSQLKAMGKAIGGLDDGHIQRSISMDRRLSSLTRSKGSSGGAVASILGVEGDFTAGDLKGLDMKGGGADVLLGAAGIKDEKIIEHFKELAGKGKGGLREAMEYVTSNSKELKDGRDKKDLSAAEANDPLQSAIKKNGEMANEILKKIAVATGVSAVEMAKLGQKDPEPPVKKP